MRSRSLTRDYLSGRKSIPIPKSRRKFSSALKIKGASEHNLKNLDVEIPLGVFTCVTGVSGSGKSTLIHEVLYQNLLRARGNGSEEAGACKSVTGAHRVGDIVMVDQAPLSRTPRSTPILYLGVYDRVRELFAGLPEAMAQGLTASAFSFNSGSGRCERCGGTGFEKIEMQFLSDLYVRCAECEGRRFQPHVLKVKLEGRSIHEVLELTVSEAVRFFTALGEAKTLARPLLVLEEVGLGYLRLGQPLNTLSGGESQRLKLVRHLTDSGGREAKSGDLFIFDEPTTGLHFDDIALLVRLFQRLVEAGNSIVVIEHNLEVMKCADWIIDLGPEGGEEGGQLVTSGTPEEVARMDNSHTGRFLRELLPRLGSAGAPPAGHAPRGTLPHAHFALTTMSHSSAPPKSRSAVGQHDGRGRGRPRSPISRSGRDLRDRHPRRARAQSQEHLARHPARPDGRHHRPERLGKSTIAFDLLFAEGQRRFLDSMSPYARQFVEQLEKPDVDLIEGLRRPSRSSNASPAAAANRPSPPSRKFIIFSGCSSPKPARNFARTAICRWKNRASPRSLGNWKPRRGAARSRCSRRSSKRGKVFIPTWRAGRSGRASTRFTSMASSSRSRSSAKLERFKEHTIDAVVGMIDAKRILKARNLVQRALDIGRGTAHLLDAEKSPHRHEHGDELPGLRPRV